MSQAIVPSRSSSTSQPPRRPTRDVPPPPPESPPPAPAPWLPSANAGSSVLGDDEIPRAASPEPEPEEQSKTLELTAIRAHYLKKTLIQLQFHAEILALVSPNPSGISTLSYLGPPFTRPPKDDRAPLDMPFLRYVFRQFILTFPFLSNVPPDFFPDKVQPFVSSLLTRSIFSPTSIFNDEEQDEDSASTAKLLNKAERSSALLLNYAVKIAEPEQVVRLTQQDLARLETLARRRAARATRKADVFDVNIIGVRAVTEKGRVRSRVHEEFIIRLRRSRQQDVYVSRRYGDFKTLADELRKRHPEEFIKPPPAKDRTFATAPTGSTLSPTPSRDSVDSILSSPTSPTYGGTPQSRLAREKNRLTLRAYLHALLALPAIAGSPVIASFLTSGPIQLSALELEDARRREEMDRQRDEGRKHFADEVAARVDALRGTLKDFKGDVLGKDGLTHLFSIIKTTENVRDLPPDFQAVIEWGRISLASTVFHHYVASDDASESIAGLKRIHGLMPYFLLKSALKISNPVGMIRAVLELFTAQPFGGRSLLQRMFTSSLYEDVKGIQEEIQAVMDKVDDPMLCEKIRTFVYAPREIQAIYRADADSEGINILTAVLRSPEAPQLSRAQMHRVLRAHRAHAEYMRNRSGLVDSDDDDGPQDEDAWLFEDLSILAKLTGKLRDKEQLIELIFEGTTADLLKDIITIFYAPLAQVYRAASIADSIGDLQTFINDLIKTVDSAEELTQEDPRRTVQIFIDLIARHEQAFYSFVHKVHSKGEGLFSALLRWIELFLTVAREGLGQGERIPLEVLLPHSGQERADILAEIDAVALYHYRLKVAYETKLRRRFGQAAGASAEDEAAAAIVDGFVRDFSYGDIMKGDAEEVAAEDDRDEFSDEEEYGDEDSGEDDEESDSEEESDTDSYETATTESEGPATATLSSSNTMPAPRPDDDRTPTPSTRTPSFVAQPQPQPVQPQQKTSRQRLTSITGKGASALRRARSMTFDESKETSPTTRHSIDAPPVPALPAHIGRGKPLPSHPAEGIPGHERPPPPPPKPSSSRSSLLSNTSRPQSQARASPKDARSRSSSAARSPPKSPKKVKVKERTAAAKMPELTKVPELLPLFVEMMRPMLRPRSD
ncbi:hypothetical protein PENSPDRAFT_637776 [Peniophora sp. CONT]|nr:hypothetical protein PENSPDRAFT_637776 [Peniophora sp. CONT]